MLCVSAAGCLMAQDVDKVTKAKQRGSVGVDLALRRLRKLHVFLARHEPSQLQQHHLDAVGVLPLGQCSYSMHVNLQDRTMEIMPHLGSTNNVCSTPLIVTRLNVEMFCGIVGSQ